MRYLAIVVLVLLGLAAAACGSDEAPAASGDGSSGWLRDDVLKDLRDSVESDAAKHGWAAGCAWREGALPNGTDAPLVGLGLEGEAGIDYGSGTLGVPFTEEDRAGGFQGWATIYAIDYTGPPVEEWERVDGDGFVCLKPVEG